MAFITTKEDLYKLCEEIPQQEYVVVDTETTGLTPWHGDRQCGVGLCFPDERTFYIPFRHINDPFLNIPLKYIDDLWEALLQVKQLVGHNIKFDLAVMYQDRFMPLQSQILTDVLVAARLCAKERHPTLGLRNQIAEYFGEEHAQYDDEMKAYLKKRKWHKHFDYAPVEFLGDYCEKDTLWTKKLWERLEEKILETKQTKVWVQEQELTQTLWHMECRGITIDREYGRSKIGPLRQREAELTHNIHEAAGYEFNVNSSKQLGEVMSNLGLTSHVKSIKTGNPSWSVGALMGIDHPIAGLTLEMRGIRKLANDYFEPLVAWPDGAVHCQFRSGGTVHGRMSCTNPNLQNIAKNVQDLSGNDTSDEVLAALGAALGARQGQDMTTAAGGTAGGITRGGMTALSSKYTDDDAKVSVRRLFIPRKGYLLYMIDFCLEQDTLVETPYGDTKIKDLEVGDIVYGHDGKRPNATRVKNKWHKGLQECYEVVLDNGKSFIATAAHKVPVLVDNGQGSWSKQPVSSLMPGMRLLPFRRSVVGSVGHEYSTLYSTSNRLYMKEHLAIAEVALGPRPNDVDVHHKNIQRFDNRPENLEYVDSIEHKKYHSRLNYGVQDHMYRIERLREGLANRDQSGNKNPMYGKRGKDNPTYGQDRGGHRQNCLACDVEFRCRPGKSRKYCSRSCYSNARRDGLNHKIVSIRSVGLRETYDIEVEDERHVFALSCGVYTSNSQMEMRVFADYVRDEGLSVLLEDANFDFHSYVAKEVWPVDENHALWSFYRTLAKAINFGLIYGIGVKKLAAQIQKTEEEAREYKDAYFARFPKARTFISAVSKTAETRGWLKNRFNRRYWLESDKGYVGVNYLVAGTSADIVKNRMNALQRYINENNLGTRLLVQVHDEVVFEIPYSEATTMPFILKDMMEERIVETFLPVDVSRGDLSWAEKHDVKKEDGICYIGNADKNEWKVDEKVMAYD